MSDLESLSSKLPGLFVRLPKVQGGFGMSEDRPPIPLNYSRPLGRSATAPSKPLGFVDGFMAGFGLIFVIAFVGWQIPWVFALLDGKVIGYAAQTIAFLFLTAAMARSMVRRFRRSRFVALNPKLTPQYELGASVGRFAASLASSAYAVVLLVLAMMHG